MTFHEIFHGIYWDIPSGKIVMFHSCLYVYQRVCEFQRVACQVEGR